MPNGPKVFKFGLTPNAFMSPLHHSLGATRSCMFFHSSTRKEKSALRCTEQVSTLLHRCRPREIHRMFCQVPFACPVAHFQSPVVFLGGTRLVGRVARVRCGDELLPTPTRPHYTFNLRDVSKARWEVVAIPPWRRGRPAGGCFEDIGILFDLLQIDRGQGAKVLLAKSSWQSTVAATGLLLK